MSSISFSSGNLDNSLWRVSVGGRVYGPYSGVQMKGFVAEGRIAAHSIIMAGESGPWITAIDDPVLGQLFVSPSEVIPVRAATEPVPAHTSIGRPSNGSTGEEGLKPRGANFVIIADIRSRNGYAFERELEKIGEAYRLNTTCWLVHTEFPVGQVRNSLLPHLGKTDSLMVVDSTNGKSAWFNLGPEAEARIRKIWRRGP